MPDTRISATLAEPMAKPTRSLVDHTEDVATAFAALFGKAGEPPSFARRWLAFFRLSESDLETFLRNGRLACFVHDWGKANTGFAAMLVKKGKQAVRHEVLSACIMNQGQVWRWLESADGIDLPLVLASIAGHHLKAAMPEGFRDAGEFGAVQPEATSARFTLTWDHPAISAQIAAMASEFGISSTLPGGVPKSWTTESKAGPGVARFEDERRRAVERLEDFEEEIRDHDSTRARMLRAVRSALIAADSAGSALFRTHQESKAEGNPRDHIKAWIDKAFDPEAALTREVIEEAIIRPSIGSKIDPGNSFAWNPFQEACEDPGRVPPRALLIAPCGSGKTLAAWRWIAARCRERRVARAIFLYPTRGTATEGFRDYAGHAGPDLAALVHGTAELDLDEIRPDIPLEDRIAESRLFALQQWPKRVFSATVDQFLAFMQHGYASTCLLPLLADSAVVLDEVHSYDRGMFTALMQFLEHFDVPVLAMTATMPESRKADLRRHLAIVDGLDFAGEGSRLRQIADHPRYRIEVAPGPDEAHREAEAALAAGLRVLWVVNTVDRAQALARAFAANAKSKRPATTEGTPIHCYHSRYRLRDRRDRHADVVKGFGRSGGAPGRAVLGIATQVCEMSLDLDCDVLISEFAPVSSLIQRLGRCCRDQHAHEPDRWRTGRVVLYKPDSILPYKQEEMKGVDRFIGDIAGKAESQASLEVRLAALDGSAFLSKDARFITDGPWAAAGQDHFRDGEDRSRQAILPKDEGEYQELLKSDAKWRAQELILPIPKDDCDPDRPAWMPSWLSFARAKRHGYSEAIGYFDEAGGGHQIA